MAGHFEVPTTIVVVVGAVGSFHLLVRDALKEGSVAVSQVGSNLAAHSPLITRRSLVIVRVERSTQI